MIDKNLDSLVFGFKSPKPTVVSVIQAKYTASNVGIITSAEKCGLKAGRSCGHSQDQAWKRARILSLDLHSPQPTLHMHKANVLTLQ